MKVFNSVCIQSIISQVSGVIYDLYTYENFNLLKYLNFSLFLKGKCFNIFGEYILLKYSACVFLLEESK